jgi:uncharacterized transporter YbjL
MNSSQSGKISGKAIALMALIAIVTAVAVTFIQRLLLGNSSPAVTGAVVGGVTATMVIGILRKRSS